MKHLKPSSRLEILRLRHAKANAPLRYAQNDKHIFQKLGCSQKYRPQPKPEKRNYWGSRLLAGMVMKGKPKKSSPGQMRLPWAPDWEVSETEVHAVAQKFTQANCTSQWCQVSESQKAQGFVKSTSVVNLNNSPKPL